MATQGQFMSRDEYRRQKTLDEARRQGKIPAAVDEEGREINPHMPQYIIHAPWYLNYNGPSLKHQRIRVEPEKTKLETWYPRGLKGQTASKYVRGACQNCGATTHEVKDCCERPRKTGAQYNGSDIKADDVIVNFDNLNYDEKRDRWNGYDPDSYKDVILEHQLYEQKRKEIREKELGEKAIDDEFHTTEQGENQTQITSRDPRTKTMTRNLRIREDQANYLLNLDTNSAYFDPKSRSLRDNPNPHLPDEKQTFKGLNAIRNTGDTLKLFQQETFAWHHSEKNNLELNSVALPTLTEKTHKQIKQRKEQQKIGRTGGLLERYGGEEHLDAEMDLILGQTDKYVEYNEMGQPVNTRKKDPTKSKYPEDVCYGEHLTVWGSWWNETLGWGYECCHSNEKHSACLGEKGKRFALTKEYEIRRQLQEEANKKEKILENNTTEQITNE